MALQFKTPEIKAYRELLDLPEYERTSIFKPQLDDLAQVLRSEELQALGAANFRYDAHIALDVLHTNFYLPYKLSRWTSESVRLVHKIMVLHTIPSQADPADICIWHLYFQLRELGRLIRTGNHKFAGITTAEMEVSLDLSEAELRTTVESAVVEFNTVLGKPDSNSDTKH